MSNAEPAALDSLAARLRDELEVLDSVVQRALVSWSHAQEPAPEHSAYLDSVALNVHGLYSGVERLLELIARHIDQTVPGGDAWHRELLYQMTHDVPGVRPAVFGVERAAALDDLRRFRHVRHLYAIQLDRQRMNSLLAALPALWPEVRADLSAFAEFLEDLARRRRSR